MSEKNLLEVVRIKDPQTGAEYNATRAHAKNIGANVLEGKPVRDPRTGVPIPSKPRTDLAGRSVEVKSPKNVQKES